MTSGSRPPPDRHPAPPLGDSAGPGEIEASALALSPAEERFERWRRTTGLVMGPLAFAVVWLLPLPLLAPAAHRLSAIVTLVVLWWMTEPVPLPVTALIGASLMVVCGVASAQDAFAPFANPTIFLFIGSFMIGQAVAEHGLDRRIAFSMLSLRPARGSLVRVCLAMATLTLLVSAWMSNTATTAMMLPVALGVLRAAGPAASLRRGSAAAFLLAVAYAASIGGIMTPVGTPPNLIALGLLDRLVHVRVNFLVWMIVTVPISLATAAVLFAIVARRLGGERARGSTAAGRLSAVDRPTGAWTAGQRNCAIAFGVAVTLWVTPGLVGLLAPGSPLAVFLADHLHESVVAIVAACLLFVLPVNVRARRFTLTWASAARIDWGTILLFGGGLALGEQMFVSGLADHVGRALVEASGATSLWAVTAIAIATAIPLTEITSNTAATNMLVPVILSIAHATGVDPVPPALGVALGASMAFVLPVSTPPNAIVYGSGLVPILTMVRMGVLLDLVAFAVIWLGLRLLCPVVGLA